MSLEEIIEEVCVATDEFAKKELTPGTPIYTFQQSMILNVKNYRQAKQTRTTICEHSGVEWNSNGKVVGVNP